MNRHIDRAAALLVQFRKQTSGEPGEWRMSEATLEAIAAEAGLPALDPNALRDSKGNLLYPTPPMLFGILIRVVDGMEFGTIALNEMHIPMKGKP